MKSLLVTIIYSVALMLLGGCGSMDKEAPTPPTVKTKPTSQEQTTPTPTPEPQEENITTQDNPPAETGHDHNHTGDNTTQPTYLKITDTLYINPEEDLLLYVDPTLDQKEKLIYNNDKIKTITQEIYRHVNDRYDFIFLITNNKTKPVEVSYSGVFLKVQNDVQGIGDPLYDNTASYGSDGKLKGIMHFAYRSAITRGPTLHEISHYWANKFRFDAQSDGSDGYYLGAGAHWGYTGFYGGKGQLGGFDAAQGNFQSENKSFTHNGTAWNLYSADYFGTNANGGNGIPYNDVELYLMGMLPKSEVKDLLIPQPWGRALEDNELQEVKDQGIYQPGRRYFLATDMLRKSWSDVLSEHQIPDRKPASTDSQKTFRILTVLLDTQIPKSYAVKIVSHHIESLAYRGDDHDEHNYNFWEATRGVGSLVVNHLSDTLKTTPEAVALEEDFTPETITFHDHVYRTVRSPYTGRIWLDRNLGAANTCQSFTDSSCYGHYFQYGRGHDGHQLESSPVSSVHKNSVTNNDNTFVLQGSSGRYDWVESGIDDDLSARHAFVIQSDGSGICPAGFRLPTIDELAEETTRNPLEEPFPGRTIESNFLKLPLNGYRNFQNRDGGVSEQGTRGAYWSSSFKVSSDYTRVRHLLFDQQGHFNTYYTRNLAYGEAIRCIQGE